MKHITWTVDHPGEDYSSRTGTDEDGNTFHVPANGETVTVKTADGREAIGWTAEEALAIALSLPSRALIQAAPKLLEACEAALKFITEDGRAPYRADEEPVIEKLTAAIAAAKGS
jgi:hypothetical protein